MDVDFKEIFAGPLFKGVRYGEDGKRRTQNAKIIIRQFMRAGFPLGVAMAALANAYHESGLSNNAMGDKNASGRHESVGLFQLRWSDDDRGAGVGMSDKKRQNPLANTRRIIKETKDYGSKLMQAYRNGATVGELTVIFGRDIERPADRGVGRDKTAYKLFGKLANVPAKDLDKAIGVGAIATVGIPVIIGGTVLLVGIGALIARR